MRRTGIDCFAGIGGFSLAMRNCGIEPKVQIEIDEYCQRVLEKNFPKAKRFRDICTVSANDLRRYRPWIVCGGFPCQDISSAGKGVGANEGERSGLWREMWRLIRVTRPTWLLIENVAALRTRGSDSVLAALEALGYTTWPLVVGACHVGAPHQRKRIWIVAYSDSEIRRACGTEAWRAVVASIKELAQLESVCLLEHAHSNGVRKQSGGRSRKNRREEGVATESSEAVGDTNSNGQSGCAVSEVGRQDVLQPDRTTGDWKGFPAGRGIFQYDWEEPRTVESGLGRTIDGLSGRLDKHRIKALGNAIVPQVAEAILRSIIAVEEQLT